MARTLKPKRSDKFAFGIWCVMNRGADPFGVATRSQVTGLEAIRGLGKRGVYGFEYHDNDLWPLKAGAAKRKALASGGQPPRRAAAPRSCALTRTVT